MPMQSFRRLKAKLQPCRPCFASNSQAYEWTAWVRWAGGGNVAVRVREGATEHPRSGSQARRRPPLAALQAPRVGRRDCMFLGACLAIPLTAPAPLFVATAEPAPA